MICHEQSVVRLEENNVSIYNCVCIWWVRREDEKAKLNIINWLLIFPVTDGLPDWQRREYRQTSIG